MEALIRFVNIPIVETSVKTAGQVYFSLKVMSLGLSHLIRLQFIRIVILFYFAILATKWLAVLEL